MRIKKYIIVLCQSLLIFLSSFNSAYAVNNISIYDHSYGEILLLTNKEAYETLSESDKTYLNSIPAEMILGYRKDNLDQNTLNINQNKNIKYTEPWLIVVSTTASLSRTNASNLKFGGSYNSTYPVIIRATAYLIRKSDGRIIKTVNKNSNGATTGISISENQTMSKGDEKYYCTATGMYTTATYGTQITSQTSLAIN